MAGAKVQIMSIRRLVPPPTKPKRKSRSPSNTEDSEEGSQQVVRRTRTGKPKVKTGCLTCKIRRIKCDEAKPSCEKCTSTGRKCDGYLPLPTKPIAPEPKTELVLCRSIDISQGSPAEGRALNFFHTRTAPALASYFDEDFWSKLVLQVSYSEPVIRHAIIAVGTLNERRVRSSGGYAREKGAQQMEDPFAPVVTFVKYPEEHNDPFALQQYNKAIFHLARRMDEGSSQSADIALLACILFVCLEFLRSNDNLAIQHFNAGKNIAMAAVAKANGPSSLRKYLLPFFNRLELLFMLFGNRPTWPHPVTVAQAVPSVFTSLREARDSVMHLMVKSVRFIRAAADRKYANAITLADYKDQMELLRGLDVWKAAFDVFFSSSQINLSMRDMHAATLLDIHRLLTITWLRRSLSPLESATDEDNTLYEQAVSLAEMLQAQPPHIGSNTTPITHAAPAYFLFDMEIVSPLYMLATKCRHPTTRRRAIALLRSQLRREGLWDSNVAAAVATKVMEIEEAGLQGVLDGSILPSEEVRVHNAQIAHKEGLHTQVHVEFWTFPHGRDAEGRWIGGMEKRKEVIVMVEDG